MKKLLLLAGMLLAVVAFTFAVTCPDAIMIAGYNLTDLIGSNSASLVSMAGLPWLITKGDESIFKEMTADEIDKLAPEEQLKYLDAKKADDIKKEQVINAKLTELIKDSEGNKETITELRNKLAEMSDVQIKELLKSVEIIGTELKKQKNIGIITGDTFKSRMQKAFDEKASELTLIKDKRGEVTLTIAKATQSYGDIDSGLDYAQMRPGVIDKVVRRPNLRVLFGTIPISGEYYKYAEQETVLRDAQMVAQCSPVVSNTKETLLVTDVTTKIVKDMMTFCRDFVADYPFMQSRIDKLIRESVALKIDQQLLHGTGIGLEMNSIESVSSEFSAANVDANIALSIQAANMIDLIKGMDNQISELSHDTFMADYVIVNRMDWYKYVESLKDANDNYLLKDVSMIGGRPFINGRIEVLTSSICVQNTLYLFDSTKGEILDRMTLEVEISTTDGTDWQAGLAKIMAKERLNFIVPNEWKNAFMKCSDVATAITAITSI